VAPRLSLSLSLHLSTLSLLPPSQCSKHLPFQGAVYVLLRRDRGGEDMVRDARIWNGSSHILLPCAGNIRTPSVRTLHSVSLDVSEPYGPPRPVIGIALQF
jgi:hypothetical protein